MIDDIQQDADARMRKTVDATRDEMNRIRTGRASPALLDHLMVEYYGVQTPVSQVATVAV
ncbi:MAG: ribosome recycling factor, partial [Gammaproteobacteria bacterium]|nr:ribosome recycling factor [Gammaproteobacteria bacterium]